MRFFLFLLVSVLTVFGNEECLKKCETEATKCCSTLLKTLPMPKTHSCYFNCNVTILHLHSCECPNDCSSFLKHGQCINDKCVCLPEWTGADCSIPSCPLNKCNGNGRCVQDRCICNDQWTGFDCSSPVIQGLKNPLPFGTLFPNETYWSSRNGYKDFHPIFNQSTLTSLYLNVKKEDLASLFNPATIWFHDYIKGNLTIDVNGKIHQYFQDVGLRVKGKSSRSQIQKNLVIALDRYGNSDRRFFGIDRIGLKFNDHSNVKYSISLDLWRAGGSRTQRHTFANLFINGIHYGLMWMAEEITKDFIKARYDNHKGNLYKMDRGKLIIEGQGRPIDYKLANRGFSHGRFRYNYNLQTNKPGTFQDIADFIYKLNKTSNQEFDKVFGKVFDVSRYIRAQIIELCVNQPDGYTLSNANYQLYHDPQTGIWDFIPFDPQHSWMGWRVVGECKFIFTLIPNS